MDVAARRRHNRQVALDLARAGFYIFPSSGEGKSPLIIDWTFADHDVKNLDPTIEFQGSTRDEKTIKRMWRRFPDAVPSISTGPSQVLVLDADTKRNGPTNLCAWFDENNIDRTEFPTTITRSGGLHVYLPNEARHGCSAGAFHDMGVDVKGVGGQVIAPGAVREDGKTYTNDPDTPLLDQTDIGLLDIPSAVLSHARAASQNAVGNDKEEERRLIDSLETDDWEDPEFLLDPLEGKYDLDALCSKDNELADLLSKGESPSTSEARFALSRALWAEYGESFSVTDFASILTYLNDLPETEGLFGDYVDHRPGEGEFNNRSLARDYYRAYNTWRKVDGSAFQAVDDIDEEHAPASYKLEKAKSKSYLLVRASDVALSWSPQQWAVKRFIPYRGVGMLAGDANVGKSFIAISLARAVSLGENWFGEKTRQGNVVYIPGEGIAGIDGRLRALQQHFGDTGPFDVLQGRGIDLFDDSRKSKDKIIKAIKAAQTPESAPLRLIILDTLAACAPTMNENDATDINKVLAHARDLEAVFECAVLIVHHLGKDKEKGMRGSSALRGNTDFVLIAEYEDEKKQEKPHLRVDKMRDGAKKFTIKFKLQEVLIGQQIDDDGEIENVTSCVALSLREAEEASDTSSNFSAVNDNDDEEAAATEAPTYDNVELPEDPPTREERKKLEKLRILESQSPEAMTRLILGCAKLLDARGAPWRRLELFSQVQRSATALNIPAPAMSTFNLLVKDLLLDAKLTVWRPPGKKWGGSEAERYLKMSVEGDKVA